MYLEGTVHLANTLELELLNPGRNEKGQGYCGSVEELRTETGVSR